jgi:hypothetical protein
MKKVILKKLFQIPHPRYYLSTKSYINYWSNFFFFVLTLWFSGEEPPGNRVQPQEVCKVWQKIVPTRNQTQLGSPKQITDQNIWMLKIKTQKRRLKKPEQMQWRQEIHLCKLELHWGWSSPKWSNSNPQS